MREMTAVERFHAVMNFEPFDRLPIVEWASYWDKTIERWRGEGLPLQLDDRVALARYFGNDVWRQGWMGSRSEETPRAQRSGLGVVANEADYDRILPTLYRSDEWDFSWWAAGAAERARTGGEVLWLTLDGFFWHPRELMGIEGSLLGFYDEPRLMHRMNEDLLQYNLKAIEAISRAGVADFVTFAEDMSYNHGPMFGKGVFDEFMAPCYRRIVPRLRELGILVIVDSDGDITVPAGWFEEAGVEGMLPLERQSGIDVAKLRAMHQRMRFIGAYDKMVMWRGEAAMRKEFERLLPVAAGGGLVVGCDHQTPPQVSLEDYRLYLRLFREYAEKAGRMSQSNKGARTR